jgi:hypothetical protein
MMGGGWYRAGAVTGRCWRLVKEMGWFPSKGPCLCDKLAASILMANSQDQPVGIDKAATM